MRWLTAEEGSRLMLCGMKCFDPIFGLHVGMNEECAKNIIGRSEKALGLAVVRGCVWAGEAEGDAKLREVVAEGVREEFPSVVALHTLNGKVVLGMHVSEESLKSGGCVRFVTKGKSP